MPTTDNSIPPDHVHDFYPTGMTAVWEGPILSVQAFPGNTEEIILRDDYEHTYTRSEILHLAHQLLAALNYVDGHTSYGVTD